MQQLANWAGNHVYRAAELHRPATVAQLREIVARAPRVRALGTRHSFSDMGDSAELVTRPHTDPSDANNPKYQDYALHFTIKVEDQ